MAFYSFNTYFLKTLQVRFFLQIYKKSWQHTLFYRKYKYGIFLTPSCRNMSIFSLLFLEYFWNVGKNSQITEKHNFKKSWDFTGSKCNFYSIYGIQAAGKCLFFTGFSYSAGGSLTYTFSVDRVLFVHVITSTLDSPYTVVKHTDQWPFLCTQSFNVHIKSHKCDGPYTWPDCGKTLPSNLNQKNQMWVASGKKAAHMW